MFGGSSVVIDGIITLGVRGVGLIEVCIVMTFWRYPVATITISRAVWRWRLMRVVCTADVFDRILLQSVSLSRQRLAICRTIHLQ
jgi:hypothetical protein